ncbi:unnamed protein product [Psylliodes chrysocephalus]|uniref:Uncharacterized protein n=1 Tax=Psylliodes chrysocephalus TaxID=3402493 RepID=A0A9P0CEE3_9CUCU|nr:unnamed protein product [Psylliodes chrysocephala]
MSGKTVPEQLSNYIKERFQFLREENARMEEILRRLKFLNEEMRIPVDISEKVSEIKDQVYNLEATTYKSQAERLRKHHNYLSKLKICIKIYVNINERLSEDIKTSKRELEQSKEKLCGILNLSSEQIQQLEEKAKRYENEVVKFEKKYPWLKDPMFNLPNISKEVEKLRILKDTKEKLVEELSVYQDLKPDISEATQQLAHIKEEHKKMSSVLLDS